MDRVASRLGRSTARFSVGVSARRLAVWAAVATLPSAGVLGATPYQWVGSGSTTTPGNGNWSSTTAWTPATPSATYLGGSDVQLTFNHTSGTAAYTSTNDIVGAFQLNKLQITNNGNSGSKIGFGTGASLQFVADNGLNPEITANNTQQFLIDVPLSTSVPLGVTVTAGNLFFGQAIDLGTNNTLTLTGATTGQVQFSGAPSIVSGTGSSIVMNLTGVNALMASSAASTYSGGTTINGGLYVAAGSSNGTATNVAGGGVTISGFTNGPLGTGDLTLQKTGTASVSLRTTTNGSRTLNNNIKILSDISLLSGGSGNVLTLNGNVTLGDAATPAGTQFVIGVTGASSTSAPAAFAGNISDANTGGVGMRLPTTANGVLRLSGNNTFSGPLSADGGTIQLINATSGGGGDISANTGGRVSFSAAPTLGAGKSITVTSNAGALGVIGVGYNGVPTFTNTTGGVLAIDVGGTTFNQAINLSTLGNGQMRLGSIFGGTYNATTLTPASDSIYRLAGGGGALTFAAANVLTGNNAVSVGSTATNGAGSVVLSAAQNYTGATTVAAGSGLTLGATNTLPSTTGVSVGGTGSSLTLTATNAMTTTPLSLSSGATVNLNAAGAYGGTVLNTIASGVTVSANVSGAYAGSPTITVNSGGTLSTTVAAGTPFGTGTVLVDGTLAVTGTNGSLAGATAAQDVTNFQMRSGSTLVLGNGSNNNSNRYGNTRTVFLTDSSFSLLGGSSSVSEVVGALSLSGQNNLNVQRQNSTNITATLTVSGIERPNRGIVLVKGTNAGLGGTSNFNNLIITGQSATAMLPPYILDNTSTNTFTRYIATTPGGVAAVNTYVTPAAAAAGTGVEIVDVTAALDLVATNRDYLAVRTTGNITSTGGGSLRIRSGGLLIPSGTTSISAPLVFDAEAVMTITPNVTLSGAISGPDGLTKAGSGVVTLTSSGNSYVGQTTVARGTLAVNSGGVLGQGDVLVTHEGTLSLLGTNNIIPDTAQVSLLSDGVNFGLVNLGTGVNETVGGLLLGGITQLPGTYGNTGSGATNILPNYFTGTGVLTVVPEPATAGLLAAVSGWLLSRRRRRI